MPVVPTPRRLRQKDLKLEIAWETQGNPVSRNKRNKLTRPKVKDKYKMSLNGLLRPRVSENSMEFLWLRTSTSS